VTSVRFILSAHPYAFERGDAAVTRLVMEAAAEVCTVRGSALWSDPVSSSPFPVDCVPRPPLRLPVVALRSALGRRSLIHTRFDVAALARDLRDRDEDRFAAVHTYMAEPFLSAFGADGHPPLFVNHHVSNADVVRATPGLRSLRAIEARRTWRDEVRCCSAAVATGGFSAPELDALGAAGVDQRRLLRISYPPAPRPSAQGDALLFLGTRFWRPNLDGLRHLCAQWPAITQGAPGATLVVVGDGPVPREAHQSGIEVLGFVDSLASVWPDVRALVAPLAVGGGVRVKILEAAARGVPVIASTTAVGSLAGYLPLHGIETDQLTQACISILRDPAGARRTGDELYQANAAWWSGGHFQADVAGWLGLSAPMQGPSAS
jgi:glycosyltransferase involved in cell wall biosynthesis